jgi:hypothetical protein
MSETKKKPQQRRKRRRRHKQIPYSSFEKRRKNRSSKQNKQSKLTEEQWSRIKNDPHLRHYADIWFGASWTLDDESEDEEIQEMAREAREVMIEAGLSNPERYVDDLSNRSLMDLTVKLMVSAKKEPISETEKDEKCQNIVRSFIGIKTAETELNRLATSRSNGLST